MKKLMTCLSLLALLSCKNDTVKPLNGTEIEVEKTGDPKDAATEKAIAREIALEDEITVLQKNIMNSTAAERKELLERYLSYSPKMDGYVSEIYCLFAYEYEQENTSDLYSVLTSKDTELIKRWADEAAGEVAIQIETQAEAEAFLQDLKHTNEAKAKDLEPAQKELFNIYHKELEKKVYTYISK